MLDQDFGWAPPLPTTSLAGQAITINVTTEDIELGSRGHNRRCPIARAIQRIVPSLYSVVGCESVDIYLPNNSSPNWYRLPPVAAAFVRNFDEGLAVAPLNFQLEYEPKASDLK